MSDIVSLHIDPGGAVLLALAFLLGALFDRRYRRWREMRAAKARFLAAQRSEPVRWVNRWGQERVPAHQPARTVREATGEADRG